MRNTLVTCIRLFFTLILFIVIAAKIDFKKVSEIFLLGSPGVFALGTAVLASTNFLNAVRWRLILRSSGLRLTDLLKVLFIGWFFNQILPTGIGGDAVRAWRCQLRGVALKTAIGSIVLDRATGYAALVATFAANLPLLLETIKEPNQQIVLLLVLAGSAAGLVAIFLVDLLPKRLSDLPVLSSAAVLSIEARRIVFSMNRGLPVFALAVAATGLTVLSTELLADCIGVRLRFSAWLAIVPPVALLQLFPISIGGWGVREAAMVTMLGAFGVPAEGALAASVCIGAAQIVAALPGGLIWLKNWDLAGNQERREHTGPAI